MGAVWKWIRQYPNLVILIAGVWLTVMPIATTSYLEDEIGNSDGNLSWFAEFLYRNRDAVGVLFGVSFFAGAGMALAALWKMARRWVKP